MIWPSSCSVCFENDPPGASVRPERASVPATVGFRVFRFWASPFCGHPPVPPAAGELRHGGPGSPVGGTADLDKPASARRRPPGGWCTLQQTRTIPAAIMICRHGTARCRLF
jgi:hypothetical protein